MQKVGGQGSVIRGTLSQMGSETMPVLDTKKENDLTIHRVR